MKNEFCSPCLEESIYGIGNNRMKKSDIIQYLKDLAQVVEVVPSQTYVDELTKNFGQLEPDKKLVFLKLLQRKPTIRRVKKVFSSWLNALIQSEILEDGTRKTSRGIQCIAKDGHVCFSLGEKTIDDLLFDNGIEHDKEPHYPDSNYRGDFLINEIIIEYFGLHGDKEYNAKIKFKRKLAKSHKIGFIEIYPKDLVDTNKLKAKIFNSIIIKKYN
ncbi:hypothetical protein ACFLSA_00885 [Bacteroidota bacterium]